MVFSNHLLNASAKHAMFCRLVLANEGTEKSLEGKFPKGNVDSSESGKVAKVLLTNYGDERVCCASQHLADQGRRS